MLDYTNSSTIYLSQSTGNDSNTGYAPVSDGYGAGPLKSLSALNEILWTMRASGNLQPVTVRVIGDYYLDEPIQIGFPLASSHYASTHSMRNITFEAASSARLIGGRKLTGFQWDTFNGHRCLSLHIPDVKSGTWHFTDLYVDGHRAKSTRYPKEGTLQCLSTECPEPVLFGGSKWFIAKKEDLASIHGIEHSIVSFYHYWIDEHSPVKSYDPDTGRLEMEYRSRFAITSRYEEDLTSDLHYYLENIPQTFSETDEWYLDVENGMLYYIPYTEIEDPSVLEVIAPTLQRLVQVQGTADNKVGGIRFRNLEFIGSKGDYKSCQTTTLAVQDAFYASDSQSVHAAPGALYFEQAEDCHIENCRIACMGIHGIEIHHGCENIHIENCRIENMGAGAVKIYGRQASEPTTLETRGCVLRRNHIQNCGQRYAAGCGILINHAAHNEISENEICYMDYSGISVGWVWGYSPSTTYGNIIRNNHIHHIGMGRLSDMGGIYLLGYQNGTIIEGNRIHDINSAHYGGWGIYTDEGSSYITVENNIVYNCKSNCYHQHYGSYNTVRNNLFAYAGESLVRLSRSESHLGLLFEENTFIAKGTSIYSCNGTLAPCPNLKANHNHIWDLTQKDPILFEGSGRSVTLDEWQHLYGLDEGSIIEEPGADILQLLS